MRRRVLTASCEHDSLIRDFGVLRRRTSGVSVCDFGVHLGRGGDVIIIYLRIFYNSIRSVTPVLALLLVIVVKYLGIICVY